MTGLAVVLVLLHSAVPWSLRWRPTRDPSRTYDRATTVLGGLGLVVVGAAGWGGAPLPWPWAAAAVVLAAVGGATLPFGTAWVAGVRLRRGSRAPTPAGYARLTACAAAEEVLWRCAGPAVLVIAGVPLLVALLVMLLGFLSLHVPKNGVRAVPYLAVVGGVLTAGAAVGGLAAAAAAHTAHNVAVVSHEVVRSSPSRHRDPRRADAVATPIVSSQWE